MTRRRLRGVAAKLHDVIATPADAALALRIVLWTGALRGLKHVVPLPTLVRIARRRPSVSGDARRERQVIVLARWASRGWACTARDGCLERALVNYRYLSALGTDVRLVFGFSGGDGAPLRGHAWVAVGGRVLDEDEEALAAFSRVGAFGPDGGIATVG